MLICIIIILQTANVNNCDTLSELTRQLKSKYCEDSAETDRLYGNRERDRYHSITDQFVQLAYEGLVYLLLRRLLKLASLIYLLTYKAEIAYNTPLLISLINL